MIYDKTRGQGEQITFLSRAEKEMESGLILFTNMKRCIYFRNICGAETVLLSQ